MKQGWLFATRKNRTLFSNCKRRMENSLLLLQCFMAGVMLKKVLNERAEPPQSVQEEKRNRQAMAEDPPRQIPKRNEIEL